jgi:hypothetical protein
VLAQAFMRSVCVLGACYDAANMSLNDLGLDADETTVKKVGPSRFLRCLPRARP